MSVSQMLLQIDPPRDPERRALRREVYHLTWPAVVQNLLIMAMFIADTVMLGRFGDDGGMEALAGMGIGGPLVWSLTMVFQAVATGAVATVSRSVGERDPDKTRVNAVTALWWGLALAGVFSVPAWFASDWALRALFTDSTPGVHAGGLAYVRWNLVFFVPHTLALVATAILRGAGDTRTPMAVAVVGNVLNLFGNWLFIYGNWGCPRWGVGGAGFATGVCEALEGVLLLAFLFSRQSRVPLAVRDLVRPTSESSRRLMKVAIPAAVEPLILQTGFVIFNVLVASLGSLAMAAHRVAVAVESLTFMPGAAASSACAAVVGQSLGMKDPQRAVWGHRESQRLALILMCSIGALYMLIPRPLAGAFTPGAPDVIALAAVCIMIGALEQPFMAIAFVFQGALRGAGATLSTVWVAILGIWMIRLPVAWVVTKKLGWGVEGIWATTTLDWMARAVLFSIIFARGKWKDVKL